MDEEDLKQEQEQEENPGITFGSFDVPVEIFLLKERLQQPCEAVKTAENEEWPKAVENLRMRATCLFKKMSASDDKIEAAQEHALQKNLRNAEAEITLLKRRMDIVNQENTKLKERNEHLTQQIKFLKGVRNHKKSTCQSEAAPRNRVVPKKLKKNH